jgi:hypothetical protein
MLATTNARWRRNLLLRGSILAAVGMAGCGTQVTVIPGESDDDTIPTTTQTTTSTVTTTTMSTSTTTEPPPPPEPLCDGATLLLQVDGTVSGFAECPDKTIHRYAQHACNPQVNAPACTGMEDVVECTSHADCNAQADGFCGSLNPIGWGGPYSYCGCVYPCTTDNDCLSNEVCVCDGVVQEPGVPAFSGYAFCAPAACQTGDDCASNECGLSAYHDGCGMNTQLGCRSEGDVCRVHEDCYDQGASICGLGSPNQWDCFIPGCVIGRPLLVAGEARTASCEIRDDWSTELALDIDDLAPKTCAALSEHWQRVAALEHASVASFARFTMQLLALGAPPELLHQAQDAAKDEIEHARICYAIASIYAGRDMGPGPLNLDNVPIATDLRTAMLELIAEACVSETIGVAEAYELAQSVSDPVLRRVHRRIAADEQRHAELAWRSLAWMLERAGDRLRRDARLAFDAAARSIRDPDDPNVVAPEHGLPSGASIGALRRQALRDVVLPCADELLG